ncbi:MAG: hypothetical protein LBD22_07795 [Spirochaetaceae bacterium]|jgi:RNA polymerase sigma factor (sigma-70 family)|nr:hypothetical protein [Spirochaetaceae bacterium]
MTELNEMDQFYAKFKRGEFDQRSFEGMVFTAILRRSRYYGILERNREDVSDFVSWAYPRLSRSLKRYVPVPGVTLDAYLHMIIRLMYREYKSKLNNHTAIEQAFWTDTARDTQICQEHSEMNSECAVEFFKNVTISPRQMLMILLKSYYAISDTMINHFAQFSKLKKETIIAMIDELRKLRSHHDFEFHKLSESCQTQFYRCLSYEARLAGTEKGSFNHSRLEKLIGKGRRRLVRMRKRLSSMRIEASNKEVASVLGISKGTVDSTMFRIKQKVRCMPLNAFQAQQDRFQTTMIGRQQA